MLKVYSHFELCYMKHFLYKKKYRKVESVSKTNNLNDDNYKRRENDCNQESYSYEKKVKNRKSKHTR